MALYESLKSRGMSFVTFTDLDAIDAGVSIAHRPDAFLSEEISTLFPEDGFPVRILAYGISESQHVRIERCRGDLYALLAFLRASRIPHALSRPLAAHGAEEPTRERLERLTLLVPLWETRNGRLGRETNEVAERFLQSATPAQIAALAARHALPIAPNPLGAGIGGSDDPSGLDAGRTYTRIAPLGRGGAMGGTRALLEGLGAGAARAAGRHGTAERRAHAVYSRAVDAFDRAPHLLPDRSLDFARDFARTLEAAGVVEPERALIAGLRGIVDETLGDGSDGILRYLAAALTGSIRETLTRPHLLADLVGTPLNAAAEAGRDHAAVFRDVNARYVTTLTRIVGNPKELPLAPSEDHLRRLGALVGFHLLLLPYLVSFFQLGEERRTVQRIARALSARPRFRPGAPRIAVFTDTYYETNGVVSILTRLEKWALANERDVTIVTAFGEREVRRDGFVNLPSVVEFDLPFYRDFGLHFPSVLSVLELCEREGYDLIHVTTPGPVGACALLAARLLGIPLVGSYHTQVPEYARILTGSERLERVLWEFARYVYSQCERVLAPSSQQIADLAARGLARERLGLLRTGVDADLFHPRRRSAAFRERVGAQGSALLLYVGRVSKEKGLDLLADAYRRLLAEGVAARLVIVGDGPYRAELQAELGADAVFTGILKEEDLATAFASADLFVFPSATDTFGCVVLEAMASGMPVIVTDGGGARESVRDGATGFVARAGDAADFAAAIARLARSDAARRAMGRAAREAALASNWAGAFEALYSEYEALTTWPDRTTAARR
jgi:glycosyltransferase involved in cell wall biosynthesis